MDKAYNPDWPKLNWRAIPRIFKGIFETGPDEEKTWYDKEGNVIKRDPYTVNEVYNPFGQRHVFYYGEWHMDDPTAGRAWRHPLTSLAMAFGTGLGVTSPGKFLPKYVNFHKLGLKFPQGALGPAQWGSEHIKGWVAPQQYMYGPAIWGTSMVAGANAEHPERYLYMDDKGNYLDRTPEGTRVIKPGTWEWIQMRWGDNIPEDILEAFEAKIGEPSAGEIEQLDWIARQQIQYATPSLVKLGKQPIQPGELFEMDGQLAVMGTPSKGKLQYAVTHRGEGDRWKFKIMQDREGNWVRHYYRTKGAVKEARDRREKKDKEKK